jgi:hypothetical protein
MFAFWQIIAIKGGYANAMDALIKHENTANNVI